MKPHNKDIISDEEFSVEQARSKDQTDPRFFDVDAIEDRELEDRVPTQQAIDFDELDSSISPAADSPGDSEEDAEREFLLGVNYMPPESADEADESDLVELDEKSPATDDNLRVIDSSMPSPRADAYKDSSIN